MKTSKLLIALVLTGLLFNSCKKGDDDPAFSLRTRKARFAGEWRLKNGKAFVSFVSFASWVRYNWAFQFEGNKYDLTETGNNYPQTSAGAYLLSLTTEKDGNFTFSEQLGSQKIISSGKWEFLPKGESAKNKERVTINAQHVTEGSLNNFHIFNQHRGEFTFTIKELRNKEMVLVASSQTEPDDDGDFISYSIEYLLVQD